MTGRVVEVAQQGSYLSLFRGFLIVSRNKEEVGRVPLDDCETLVLSAPDTVISKPLLEELSERKAVVLVSGRNHLPIGIYTPLAGNQRLGERQRAQAGASKPLEKNLWASLVKGKIRFQEHLLNLHGKTDTSEKLAYLRRTTLSGDTTNREAQAARVYWTALFGEDFRRDQEKEDVNALLNYGYAILRAATARALAGAGLLMAWGVGHTRQDNPYALCDDVMEPFRPSVDRVILEIKDHWEKGVTPENKKALAKVLWLDFVLEGETVPLSNAITRLVQGITQSFLQKKNLIDPQTWGWSNEPCTLTDTI